MNDFWYLTYVWKEEIRKAYDTPSKWEKNATFSIFCNELRKFGCRVSPTHTWTTFQIPVLWRIISARKHSTEYVTLIRYFEVSWCEHLPHTYQNVGHQKTSSASYAEGLKRTTTEITHLTCDADLIIGYHWPALARFLTGDISAASCCPAISNEINQKL